MIKSIQMFLTIICFISFIITFVKLLVKCADDDDVLPKINFWFILTVFVIAVSILAGIV